MRKALPLLALILGVPAAGQSPPVRLTLDDAVRMAATRNATVEEARARADEAGARLRERKADRLPSLSTIVQQAGRTFNTATFGIDFPTPAGQQPFFDPQGQVEGPVNTLDLRARVTETLFDAPMLEKIRGARTSADAALLEADAAAAEAGAAGAAAYIELERTEAELRARQSDVALAQELLDIAQEQLRVGTGVGLDVTRAQSQLAGMRSQLVIARNARDRARLGLARVLSLPLETPIEITDSLTAPRPAVATDAAAALSMARQNRTDVQAAQQRLRAAESETRAIRAERLPSLSFVGDDGWIARNGRSFLNTYTWGVQLSVPVFDGFRRQARVQEQEAIARGLASRQHELDRQVEFEVRRAVLDLTSAVEQVDVTRTRLDLAQLELEQARERFRSGVAGNADVVTAALTLNTARSAAVNSLAAFEAARINLARAQGTLVPASSNR